MEISLEYKHFSHGNVLFSKLQVDILLFTVDELQSDAQLYCMCTIEKHTVSNSDKYTSYLSTRYSQQSF